MGSLRSSSPLPSGGARAVARRAALTAALAASLVVVGCSSDDGPDSSSATTSAVPTSPGGAAAGGASTTVPAAPGVAVPRDPCAVLPAPEVNALLGAAVPGAPGGSSSAGMIFNSCTWGELTTDAGQVALSFSAPAAETGIDYLQTLVGSVGAASGSVDVGDGGQLYHAFVRPGGGGAGSTILFKKGALSIALGQSGERVDDTRLIAAAKAVAAAL